MPPGHARVELAMVADGDAPVPVLVGRGGLAPLAHAALCLMGEGWVLGEDGRPMPAAEALARAGLAPLALEENEGRSLLGGTVGMLAMLVVACVDAGMLFRTADAVCAMSVEALLGADRPFAPALQALRPHPGQATSAANLTRLSPARPSSPRTARRTTSCKTPTRCAAIRG
jgi:histidine ammonia-lyase